MNFYSQNKTPISDKDLEKAAKDIGCEVAAIKAVSKVESSGSGYLADGRPVILFESHVFHTQTKGKYDSTHPNISTPSWVRNYGASGAHQYERLEEALKLDVEAALKACSWGKYQIMGLNFNNAGYDNVTEFVNDMVESEAYQLDAFVMFVQNTGCDEYLVNKDWRSFALHYNGSGQVDYYAQRIEAAYNSV